MRLWRCSPQPLAALDCFSPESLWTSNWDFLFSCKLGFGASGQPGERHLRRLSASPQAELAVGILWVWLLCEEEFGVNLRMGGFQACRCFRAGVILLPETGSSSSPLVTVRERELLLGWADVDWNLPPRWGDSPRELPTHVKLRLQSLFHQPTFVCRQCYGWLRGLFVCFICVHVSLAGPTQEAGARFEIFYFPSKVGMNEWMDGWLDGCMVSGTMGKCQYLPMPLELLGLLAPWRLPVAQPHGFLVTRSLLSLGSHLAPFEAQIPAICSQDGDASVMGEPTQQGETLGESLA